VVLTSISLVLRSNQFDFDLRGLGECAVWVFVGEAYSQQGRAHSPRPRPDGAARAALMSWAAHAVESKAEVRTEVAVSPRPCLGCAVELVRRVAPLRRGVSPRYCVVQAV
jgi:hypothetical protein